MTAPLRRYQQGHSALVVNPAWCKGCRICIQDCPVGILVLDARDVVVVTDISRCIFCGICAVRCPDFAITLERPPRGAASAGELACA